MKWPIDKTEMEIVDMAEHHHLQHKSPLTPPFTSPAKSIDQEEDKVVLDIKAILLDNKKPPLSSRSSCCIYEVPQVTRQINEDAYTPKLVSIGPLHCLNPNLHNMQTHKHLLFKQFIDQSHTSLQDLINSVKIAEPKVRSCYSENTQLTESELVKLILVDASFIIQLFLKNHDKGLFMDDSILSTPLLMANIWNDLLLLENQLPYFVLEQIFNLAYPPHICNDLPSFHNLTFNFFRYYNVQKIEPNPQTRIKHFTDLLRIFYLQMHKPKRRAFEEGGGHVLSYSASELHEAGVKLKAKRSKCLLALKFSGRVLEIPQISVHDRTETIFRNMIALEQCHYPFESYITDYAFVMDWLINTSKDVDVLVHQEIIRSILADSNDVAKLFNGLCKEIFHTDFNCEYLDICTRLNVFYKDPWNNMKATLRSDYCSTPWQTAASIAGILLIVFTLVQTICSVIQVA